MSSDNKIICTVNYCNYNNGYGHCTRDEIEISDAETGEPTCVSYADNED